MFKILNKFVMFLKKVIGELQLIALSYLSDYLYLKYLYKKKLGKKLNLQNPQTFNEKIQYLKLYYRNDLLTICADKFRVREYVSEKINEDILVPLLWVGEDPTHIPFETLPDSFVIKTNHGSGMNIIVKDKNKINKEEIAKKIKKWLKINFYKFYKEWSYKNIKRKIIIEQYLGDNVNDFKIFVFNNSAQFILVVFDRYAYNVRNFYNLKWELLDIKYCYNNSTKVIAKPYNLKKMINYAEILSDKFPFVRVDFYEIDRKLYFGEMTFYPNAGFIKFLENHEKWDLAWGKLLRLDF
jgi:hypothetical protein